MLQIILTENETTEQPVNTRFELTEMNGISHETDEITTEQVTTTPVTTTEITEDSQNVKLVFRRWLILAAYCVLTISNSSTNFAAASISNIVQKFYGKNSVAIDWLAIIYSLVCIIFMYPFSHVVNKKGLSYAIVAAGFFNSLGSCIRYIGSFNRQFGYWFFFAGNLSCAIATSAFLFLPSKIAAVWFGSKETATATSIAIAADSLGLALGYIQPPLMVPNNDNIDKIGNHLSRYMLTVAVQSVMTFVFICLVIKDKPRNAPSASEAAKNTIPHRLTDNNNMFEVMMQYFKVLKNGPYLVILHINGLYFAAETIWLMTLNELLIPKFPGYEVTIGSMGTVGLITSMFSNFIIGIILDRGKSYRNVTLIITSLSCILVVCFATIFYFTNNFIALYIIYVVTVGIYTTYYTTSFDHAAEVTYPISEAHSGVTLLWFAQLYSLILAQLASLLNVHVKSIWLVCFLIGLYFLAFLLSLAVKNKGSRTSYVSSVMSNQQIT